MGEADECEAVSTLYGEGDSPESLYVRNNRKVSCSQIIGVCVMHYRNGREAKNGDRIIQIDFSGKLQVGVLVDAVPGNDYCNGTLLPSHGIVGACMIDCLHVDDVVALLYEKGLDKRPIGK